MVKKNFDTLLTPDNLSTAKVIVQEAQKNNVTHIINVGTSLVESINCIMLAQNYDAIMQWLGFIPMILLHMARRFKRTPVTFKTKKRNENCRNW